MAERILVLLLFLVGFRGMLVKRNIVKKIFGLTLINSAAVILFVLEGGRIGVNAPILGDGIRQVADPVPQALMLTAIVIGVCITALALSLAVRLHQAAGSFDIDDIRQSFQHRDVCGDAGETSKGPEEDGSHGH